MPRAPKFGHRADRPRCLRHVYTNSADRVGHQCGYHAIDGTEFCHVHVDEGPIYADRRRPDYLDDLLGTAATRWRVSTDDILGLSRLAKISRARQAVMWVLRERGLSYPHIAHLMNRKDHTTVMHAVRQVEAHRAWHLGALLLERAVFTDDEKVSA